MAILDQYGNTLDIRTPVEQPAARERDLPGPASPIAAGAPQQINFSQKTLDSYQNIISHTGFGTDNVSSYGSYGFYPITRLRIILDWAFRSSWVCRVACEAVAEDMT